MKKLFFCIALLLFLFITVSADSTSTSATMDISAYKDTSGSQVFTDRIVKVKPLSTYEISASNYIPYDITHQVLRSVDTAIVSNILKVTLGGNSKEGFSIDIEFSPFVSSETGSTIPITYSYKTNTPATRGKVPSNNNDYQYEYTPSLTITGQNGTSISNKSFTASSSPARIRIKWGIGGLKRKKKSATSWSTISNNTINNYLTTPLSGVTEEKYYPLASIQFDLSVSSFSSMEANVDYIANIRVIVSGN